MEHRWAVVVISVVDEAAAALLNTMDVPTRFEQVCEVVATGKLEQVRGPICTECRVPWRAVHADDEPWPCPGKRPEALGGPLVTQERALRSRERSRERRRAERKSSPQSRSDANEKVKQAMESAIWMKQQERKSRTAARDQANEALSTLATALGDVDTEDYFA